MKRVSSNERRWRSRFRLLAALVVLTLAPLTSVEAQVSTGNIYGEVVDEQGSVLPGSDISLAAISIGGQPRTAVTDGQGLFRFLNLDPGTYKVTVAFAGLTTSEREVIVTTGVNTNISFTMSVKSLEESVTVTAQSPVVDEKKMGTATTLTREELQLVPQSRDPWAALKTVPGVIVDRVNIGGNESGQQSNFVGKGAASADTMWSMDGVVITDTNSGGASSNYFDFNAFDEVNISTGGNDLRTQTGGVGINFVTRRGTNQFRGTLFASVAPDSLESTNLPDDLVGDERLLGADTANHTDQITNYGFDIGGPIVRDRLWFWGSWAKQDIRILRLTQTKDRTLLKNGAAKVNWRAGLADDISFFWFDGAKEKIGRSPGQAGNEADSFLWNQGNFYPSGPHGLWKGEINHVFGPSVVLNAKYAWFGWGYGFAPRGGEDLDGTINFDTDTAAGSWSLNQYIKPWHIIDTSGSAFKTAFGASHEFKFGFGYIRRPSTSLTRWSGSQVVGIIQSPDEKYAKVYRERNVKFLQENWSAYFGDTVSKGRFTMNGGVRWDRQFVENQASTAAGNPTFPEFLPDQVYNGGGPTITWNDLSPRVGMSVALDSARKTVARASYAMYAGQLFPTEVTSSNPAGTYYTYIAYRWVDTNNDGFAQRAEILTNLGPQYANGVDPNNPGAATSVNTIDPDYKANHDHEFIVGLDRELGRDMAVGAAYTWRRGNLWPSWNPRQGLTSADYFAQDPQTFQGYTVQAFAPDPDLVDAFGGGRILSNRPDYHTSYKGLELTFNKRFSNRWMSRIAFSLMDWSEHFDGPGAVQNPTRSDSTVNAGLLGVASGPQVEGGQVAPRSSGSGKGDIFYNARWQLNASGLYQIPWAIDVGASLFGRQGYARPYVIAASAGRDGTIRTVATPEIDDNRYDNLWNFDVRIGRAFTVYGRTKIEVSGDLFNLFNNNVVLASNRRLDASAFGTTNEILSPRILRVGMRIMF